MADRDLSADDNLGLDNDREIEAPPEVDEKGIIQDEDEGSPSETNPDNLDPQEDKDSPTDGEIESDIVEGAGKPSNDEEELAIEPGKASKKKMVIIFRKCWILVVYNLSDPKEHDVLW